MTDVVSNRRAYFADPGIANYISSMVTVPKDATEGMLTETFAYTELSRLYQAAPGKSVFGVTSRAFLPVETMNWILWLSIKMMFAMDLR